MKTTGRIVLAFAFLALLMIAVTRPWREKVCPAPPVPARLVILNGCDVTVWIVATPNAGVVTKLPGLVKIEAGKTHDYDVDPTGWAGRLWPKTGCDSNGYNCAAGDAVPPCGSGSDAGPCEPPADTKIEFNFAPTAGTARSFYDISLVDGYSLPFWIRPSTHDKTCVDTLCDLSLASCPTDETYAGTDLGSLAVVSGGKTVQCLSPCKRWNYPAPIGMGNPETTAPGPALCCPSPVTPAACNVASGVRTTKYAKLVHERCRSAYAYSYDDAAGSHDCPSTTRFDVVLCAAPAAR
jgi:hypothetical protein